MSWRKFFGSVSRKELLAWILLLFALLLIIVALSGCAPVRTAPVGTITPASDGSGYVLNQALPQPDPDAYQPGAGLDWMGLVAQALPSPWRELVGMAVTALIAGRVAKRPLAAALAQTVNGIEIAKSERPETKPALHDALAKTQDERTKKLVWDLRP